MLTKNIVYILKHKIYTVFWTNNPHVHSKSQQACGKSKLTVRESEL